MSSMYIIITSFNISFASINPFCVTHVHIICLLSKFVYIYK